MKSYEFITEAATSIVYHYMPAGDAVRTLLDNHYSLESSTGMGVEEKWAPKGKPWYLATTRSKVGDYHIRQATTSGAMFVLNGDWLNQRYETHPIDYWEGMYRPSGFNVGADARTSESEDRVFSAEHTIPLQGSTSAVHVFLVPQEKQKYRDDDQRQGYRAAEVREIIRIARGRRIPVYLYDDKSKWMTQREQYRIDPDSEYGRNLLKGEASTYRRREYPSDYWGNIRFWVELLEKNPGDELSAPAEKLVYNLRYYGDASTSLKNDLHNAARQPTNPDYQYVIAINRAMRQYKLNTVGEIQDYLKKKWTKQ